MTAEALCASHFGLNYENITSHPHPSAPNRGERLRQLERLRLGGNFEIGGLRWRLGECAVYACATEPLPQFPERLRWWLRQLTTSGMRTIIAVEN